MALTNKEYVQKILNDDSVSQIFKDYLKTHVTFEADGTTVKDVNFNAMSNSILGDEYEAQRNEWIKILNGIGKRIVNQKMFKNKLEFLKSGELPFGSGIEEISANPAKSQPFSMTSDTLLTPAPPDIKSVYYQINREDKYETELYDYQLQRALLQPTGLNSLVSLIVSTVYNGDSMDEFELTKALPFNAGINGKIKKIIINEGDTDLSDNAPQNTLSTIANDMSDICVEMRTLADNMTSPDTQYNAYSTLDGVTPFKTFSDLSDIVILINSRFKATMDVKFLAQTFNIGKAETKQRVISLNNFGDNDNGIKMMICDKRWFRIYDVLRMMKKFENGSTLKTKYFHHHHQILQYNLLANAVLFVSNKSKIFK